MLILFFLLLLYLSVHIYLPSYEVREQMHCVVGDLLILNAKVLVVDHVAVPGYVHRLVEEGRTEQVVEFGAVCGAHPRWRERLERTMSEHVVVGAIGPLVRVIAARFAHTRRVQRVRIEL